MLMRKNQKGNQDARMVNSNRETYVDFVCLAGLARARGQRFEDEEGSGAVDVGCNEGVGGAELAVVTIRVVVAVVVGCVEACKVVHGSKRDLQH